MAGREISRAITLAAPRPLVEMETHFTVHYTVFKKNQTTEFSVLSPRTAASLAMKRAAAAFYNASTVSLRVDAQIKWKISFIRLTRRYAHAA